MTRAIVLRETGGPEKLLWEPVEVGEPGPGELRIRHTAIGVNFHDTYVRTGLYKTLPLPGIPGVEAAGVVELVGRDVTAFVPGDRVCYVDQSYGAYSEARLLPAALAFRLPDAISDEAAASLAVKGLTACMLLRHTRRVLPGETLLIHAAAGGVGQLLVHWAKHLGAKVIATVGSPEKAAIVRGCGADEVILYRNENFVERVAALTHGRGVDVVYDSVGADTFSGSLDCLGYFGTLVNFGQSSGAVPPFLVSRLAARSNAVVRPILFHYIRERTARDAMVEETFKMVQAAVLRPRIGLRLPLSRAAEAHAALESRATTGATILTVGRLTVGGQT
jgi:NADPH2:quinone reductase